MIELKSGIILSKKAPKEEVSFVFDKGVINITDIGKEFADKAGIKDFCRPVRKNGKFHLEKYLVQQNQRQ